MRIQHNIMAMNAYRNYNTNTSALSKNLEKLSSGYKINRAGDDAAGLAISEKMRAQITGLEAAQKNVKDGISLVKTAEGAMQEIQDMLNRMDYLATQSANGTYDSSVDRTNLQKEVNALRDEINRIADSANFNGIKLLDGTQAGVKAQAAWTETLEAGEFDGVDRLLTTDLADVAVENNGDVVLDKYAGTAAAGSFSIDFSKLDFGFKAGSGVAASATKVTANFGELKITIDDKEITIKASNFASTALQLNASNGAVKASAAIKASAVAKALVNAIASNTNGTATSATVTINGVDWKVTASGSKVTFAQKAVPENQAEAKINFKVSTNYSGGSAAGSKAGVSLSTKNMQDGTTIETEAVPKGATKGAEAVFKVYDSDIRDQAKITLGSKTFTIKLGADSKVTETGSNVIDLSAYEAGDEGLLNVALTKIGAVATSVNFSVATKSGGKVDVSFKVSVRDDGIAVMRATAPASAGQVYFKSVDDFKDKFKVQFSATTIDHKAVTESGGLKLQIGDTSDSFNQMGVHIGDMHTSAMGFNLDGKGEITKTGKSISDIDISTQDGAAEAIETIKNAINYVSGIRGDLGAVQNRLEHTQNNLSVMAENIQDAESTIRDTDVADEMMSYVKNNILVQSAQAMLAQANQVPQGVLQLLG